MITNPNLILYACVAKSTTILAEFSKDADLGTLALKCLQKTPKFHSIFTHTVRSKMYLFVIDDPFVFFGIFDEKFEKSEAILFLKGIQDSFDEIFDAKRSSNLTDHCFQGEFSPIFHRMVSSPDSPKSPRVLRNESLDSPMGKKMGIPLLGDINTKKGLLMKKKKNKKEKMGGDEDGDFSNGVRRNGKKVWNKHVMIVLSLDFIVCFILFGVWLWICRGFKCIDA